MTLAALQKAKPDYARAFDYAVTKRMGQKLAAQRLGLKLGTLSFRVQRARELLRKGQVIRVLPMKPEEVAAMNERLTRHGRCSCGLLNPCRSCLPSAAEVAEERPGLGATLPGGGGW